MLKIGQTAEMGFETALDFLGGHHKIAPKTLDVNNAFFSVAHDRTLEVAAQGLSHDL